MTQQKLKIARVDNLAARFPLFLMAYRHLCSEFHLHHPGSHYPCPLSWPQRRHLTLFLSFGSQSHPHSHPMSDDFLFRLFSSSVTAGTSVTSGVDILQSKVQGTTQTRETDTGIQQTSRVAILHSCCSKY